MIKKEIVWIKIKAKSYYNILTKLSELGITIYDNKKNDDGILIKTSLNDYTRIKKYLVSYKTEIVTSSGLLKMKELMQKYIVFFLSSILSIVILFLANMVIFKIDIKSSNKNIQNILEKELSSRGIKTLTLKKSHAQIEKIVNNILDNNKDTLEWLEIKYDGLIMNVYVTEKTIPKEEESYDKCNIISRTDAKITSLNLYRGVALKEINDYVTKGEVIITGEITHNEEVKNIVCASGEVYGEVWYKVKVTVPYNEYYSKYTGKKRFNISVKIGDDEYDIFKSRIKNKRVKKTLLYKLNDFAINFVEEKEYEESVRKLSEKEAYNKALKLAEDKVKLKLRENEAILYKKVLKKEVNDSTIYVEVFIVTKENIGEISQILGGSENDSKPNNENNQ